jgi:pantoate--beta-alanine ligase
MSKSTAFVPTMGALHAGHLSLIEVAKKYADDVVLSIFVNPLQFENPDDLAKYPRDLEGDSAMALNAGATQIWAPTVGEIYPSNPTIISAGPLGHQYEGVNRPGHFDGVLTVVDRLFKKIEPEFAIFGEKDFQQLFLIKQWVRDQKIPVTIIAAPLIRDSDGLALSSRNVRLGADGRNAALVISKALFAARESEEPEEVMAAILGSEPAFTLDYAVVIDEESFDIATSQTRQTKHRRALIAGWVNGVRLLDNMAMSVNA